MYILGISGLYHDSAAAIIKDGEIIAAAQEERFSRKKHDPSLPINAINYCLEEAKIKPENLEAVVYYDNPKLTLNRVVCNMQYLNEDYQNYIELNLESILKDKIWIHKKLRNEYKKLGKKDKLYVMKHHASHAASAFFPSPFSNAAIITIDGVGEWETTTIGYGEKNRITLEKKIDYPNSIGLLYSAFTYYCGFKVNSGDYKLMGLAPYGNPIYVDLIKKELIDIKEDGSFRLNMDYFDFQYGRNMINENFERLFGGKRREPESRITKREMDMAASVQKVIEEIIILLAKEAKRLYGAKTKNLVIAGGVGLNCVANGKLLREKIFDDVWIQPAAGDAGGAIGAALFYYYDYCNNERLINVNKDMQKGSYLGPCYSNEIIEKYLSKQKYVYKRYSDNELFDVIADYIIAQKVIGIFHGRMEFGPRALGNRSIIGSAKSDKMQSKLNLKIKYRESFRPFAPSVMNEKKEEYFDLEKESPYMLLCAQVKKKRRKEFNVEYARFENNDNLLDVINIARSDIPAVTHVDYSARIQTVKFEDNPYYYNIINTYYNKSGYGVIVNTSFNVRGEPIVCTPEDAYKCFMRTDMDVLVLENLVLLKEDQPIWKEEKDWRAIYELD